jgi:hypothetical protein
VWSDRVIDALKIFERNGLRLNQLTMPLLPGGFQKNNENF